MTREANLPEICGQYRPNALGFRCAGTQNNHTVLVNILVSGNLDSGILETDIPEEGNSLIGLFTTYQVVRVLSSPEPLCGAVAGFTMPQYLIGFH